MESINHVNDTVRKKVLIFDPIAFSGGSKKAINSIIQLLPEQSVNITIVTANPVDWSSLEVINDEKLPSIKLIRLFEPGFLAKAEHGLLYFIRHALLALQLLFIQLINKKFDFLVGTSGPGVDLALYLFKLVFDKPIFQFIQGPVAISKTIARCLMACNRLCYLSSTLPSIKACLGNYYKLDKTHNSDINEKVETFFSSDNVLELNNGLSRNDWPTAVSYLANKGKKEIQHDLFWAASLLEWKGLDVLLDALSLFEDNKKPFTSICYIRPKNTQLTITKAPQNITNVNWHEQPENLDKIRRKHQIFISTSDKEPFGLSVLEALAAGMVVVIPNDGAYWDQKLVHGNNCYKYQEKNSLDLKNKLEQLIGNKQLISKLGQNALVIAENYRAEISYKPVIHSLLNLNVEKKTSPVIPTVTR